MLGAKFVPPILNDRMTVEPPIPSAGGLVWVLEYSSENRPSCVTVASVWVGSKWACVAIVNVRFGAFVVCGCVLSNMETEIR